MFKILNILIIVGAPIRSVDNRTKRVGGWKLYGLEISLTRGRVFNLEGKTLNDCRGCNSATR